MDLKKMKLESLKKKLAEGHEHLAEANKIFCELYDIIIGFENTKDDKETEK